MISPELVLLDAIMQGVFSIADQKPEISRPIENVKNSFSL